MSYAIDSFPPSLPPPPRKEAPTTQQHRTLFRSKPNRKRTVSEPVISEPINEPSIPTPAPNRREVVVNTLENLIEDKKKSKAWSIAKLIVSIVVFLFFLLGKVAFLTRTILSAIPHMNNNIVNLSLILTDVALSGIGGVLLITFLVIDIIKTNFSS